jgi:prespore-specific regulator
MAKAREDAWTREQDNLLADVVIDYIRNGKKQIDAFEVVGDELFRTAAACGYRWNAMLRHKYTTAIREAKKDRLILIKSRSGRV